MWGEMGFISISKSEGLGLFRGVNTLNLDAKGRMAVPSKYRDGLLSQCAGQLVVTVDRSDACLLL